MFLVCGVWFLPASLGKQTVAGVPGMTLAVWRRHQCNGPVALHLNPQGLQSPVYPALSDAQFGLGCVGGTKAASQLSCGTGCASAYQSECVTCFPLPDSGKGAWTLLQMRQLCLIAEAPSVATGEG